MGRNFVGSNNLALIEGIGQFGTRLCGGKDHAPSRHLRTALSTFTRLIFPLEDDEVLPYSSKEQ
jgi:DNA topoisomerase II